MKKSVFSVLLAAAFCGILAVGACARIVSQDETIRYKVTVTIETPEGDKVGSAVKEALKHTEKSILPEQGGTSCAISEGQAVVIDLGNYGFVFAAQNWEKEANLAFRLLADKREGKEIFVPTENYPLFVFFKNLADPKSVDTAQDGVDCSGHAGACMANENSANVSLMEKLGRGIKIKKITVQRVSEGPQIRIDQLLPWINQYNNKQLDGNRYWYKDADHKVANTLDQGSFLIRKK